MRDPAVSKWLVHARNLFKLVVSESSEKIYRNACTANLLAGKTLQKCVEGKDRWEKLFKPEKNLYDLTL